MDKLLEVHDDWYENKLFDFIEKTILEDNLYTFAYIKDIAYPSSDPKSGYDPGFSANIYPTLKGTYRERLISQILERFSEYRNIKLKEQIASRCFIHLPGCKNKKNKIHTDGPENHLVLLYYVTDSDGDTFLFEDDEKTIIKRIKPKKGRVVFFDGSIKHCSSTPTKGTRAIINFNVFK